MVLKFKERLNKIVASKDEIECDLLIADIIIYITSRKWTFVLDVIYPPYGSMETNGFIVFNSTDMRDGTIRLIGASYDDVMDNSLSDVGYKDKVAFLKRIIPLIPRI